MTMYAKMLGQKNQMRKQKQSNVVVAKMVLVEECEDLKKSIVAC